MMITWDDILVGSAMIGILALVIKWGYETYLRVMADGQVTLDEAIEIGSGLMEVITVTKEEIEAVLATDEGKSFIEKLDELRTNREN